MVALFFLGDPPAPDPFADISPFPRLIMEHDAQEGIRVGKSPRRLGVAENVEEGKSPEQNGYSLMLWEG